METKKIYLLYRGDMWLSTLSLSLIAPFSTFEKAVDYLRKKRHEYRLGKMPSLNVRVSARHTDSKKTSTARSWRWTPNPKLMSSTTASSSMVSPNSLVGS